MPEADGNPTLEKLEEIADLLRQLVAKERPTPRRLLRLKEAADYLHISPWQLRRIAQAGELPIIKPEDHNHAPWLVDVRELDSWIERNKTNF